jgi:hypothetical protein
MRPIRTDHERCPTLRGVRARPLLVLALLAASALGVATATPAARADGDPASDVLLASSLYTPVAQKISPDVKQQLESTIAEANDAGFKVRVALILDRTDLGAVPQLFGHPDQYVQLLTAELYYGWKGAVIAVQPSGIGVRNVKPLEPAQKLVAGIKVAAPPSADGLAQAATAAVRRLAAADGHPIAGDVSTAKSSSSSTTTLIAIGGAVVVVLLAVGGGWFLLRRRSVERRAE